MKPLNLILPVLIVIASIALCYQIVSNSLVNQQNKSDYAELHHVKYGLLSIEEWKRQMATILIDEVNQMYLSRANERKLKKHIEVLLNTLIDKVDKKIREENSDSAGGRVAQSFINIFINLEDIKKGIPDYASAAIAELKKSKTRSQIKAVLNKKLEQFSSQTFDTQDISLLNRILLGTDSKDIASAKAKLKAEISVKHDLILKQTIALILLSIMLFSMSGFSQQPLAASRHIFLVIALIVLLIAGVTTPTIDMEATISQMSFVLMGHPILFENQVLYFQSKSILDVFWIMVTHEDMQMKVVGLLLITFSIIFPLIKIASSLAYHYNYGKVRTNQVIEFFVLKSGKWCMADVMVVAIFMAYIGFNGIITSQLGRLSSAGQEMVILTTNGTSLQPGYYLFMTYTLLALFLSGFLTRKPQV